MAFVREDVKGKDKDLFTSFGIIYENNLVEADQFTMWTVDRERWRNWNLFCKVL